MKYGTKTFTVPLSSEAYRDGWTTTFGPLVETKPDRCPTCRMGADFPASLVDLDGSSRDCDDAFHPPPAPKPGPSKDWIQTRAGLKFSPLAPEPDSIQIEDIAWALSHVCRYTGHVSRFYSVAEHSVRVADRVFDLTGDYGQALWALLHDASEAYLADVARPVKRLPEMAGYRALEKRIQAAIVARFGLPVEEPAAVSAADYELLGTEALALMSPLHPEWGATCPGGKLPEPIEGLGAQLGWSPKGARGTFLSLFDYLLPLVPGARR